MVMGILEMKIRAKNEGTVWKSIEKPLGNSRKVTIFDKFIFV